MIGPVLVGLGVFLIVAAGLVRFYAYPALAKVPAGYSSTTKLEANDAQVFNSSLDVLAPETHDLSITSKTHENVSADAPDGVVVWVNLTTIKRGDGTEFQKATEQVAFDEVTGEAVDCEECDQFIEVRDIADDSAERVSTTFEGQVYKFPFNTERKDYDQWDGTLGESFPATYEGEEDVQGVAVYKFVQEIEPTVIETRDVPGSVFGSDEPSVQAEMVYAMTRTFYVEPVTGSPIDRVEERTQELVYDGVRVPAFVGTVEYTDAQVDDNVEKVDNKASLLGGARVLYPVILLVLGGVLLGLGLIFNKRLSSDADQDTHQDRPLVSA
ncbi:DUF3068 domain-containing protein [Nocardioides bizhenqiangii]|uniref:DUF3068 domain-containing protein n=1 Tax=Nocardioides bizhenqiangii TaxID=3095076 RepID=A0ABZ0ZKP4_9ACTN|nr:MULTISPECIES: DUF3068 domain-containing protein [unclassified Nocardioides]MDZ5620570.1 DUF3068 domain-containing protein [Nocardioides sp. HM23]WQQ24940.1 DUF3068 domain-containing protein [Nocardioides sp. HM61]